jgi:molecular chaperone GrpE (heat shock protein)
MQFVPKVTKWPFFLGDALLLATASYIWFEIKAPLGVGPLSLAVLCVAAGAVLAVLPFLLEYRALARVAEAGALTTVVAQIQHLEKIAGQISGATGQWQSAQEQADKTARAASELAARMTAEASAFTEFLQRANDSEKATLRLEVEKLRRAENEWLQVLVRMLDHSFALHLGAVRSGQQTLIAQVGNFQNACREAARRVGLAPFIADQSEPFDAQRHQLIEGDDKAAAGALVSETLASGYTFQGRLLRPALVKLRNNSHDRDGELPLDQTCLTGPTSPTGPTNDPA